MKTLMKSIGHLGNIMMSNKSKVILGLGAIALAPALRWAMNRYLGLKAEMEAAAEEETQSPAPPKPRRNKREIYQAPSVPPQNLIRH